MPDPILFAFDVSDQPILYCTVEFRLHGPAELRRRGIELFEAVQQVGLVRFRPVLTTALTAILSLVPLAVSLGESGESWAPMARSVMRAFLPGPF